ncbi:hypothetical protein MKW98_022692 [Papaver atlanticum]|uniref:Enoyl reductase (ER) domain-containing protein n=1 Tax=Papaver atlanticum TaxID=357466 RepID=A0AAD4XRB0_9MAGN|nr:hypothetical protein MKW98_022692 [Papaver atlanticum]
MSEKVMRAVCYESYGSGSEGLKHVQVPIPKPKRDEVLVKVEASCPNPIDYKLQGGIARPIMPKKFPYIPVTDISGEVVEIGSDVQFLQVGDKVVAMLTYTNGGGLGEYAVAPAKLTVKRPVEVSAVEGAGLPLAGLTALHVLTILGHVEIKSGGKAANVLVIAASGGVGHYVVQLAKLGNNHVTATCGARNIELLKSLGADEVLDYTTEDGKMLRSPSGCKYDVVINCATSKIPWLTYKQNLSEQGRIVHLNPDGKTMMKSASLKLSCSRKKVTSLMMCPKKKEDLEFLVGLVKEGKLKTVVDSKYPLAEAEQAWAKMMGGHATGKIVVEP